MLSMIHQKAKSIDRVESIELSTLPLTLCNFSFIRLNRVVFMFDSQLSSMHLRNVSLFFLIFLFR